MIHCLYSPDLVPNALFFIPFTKNIMHGQCFNSSEEAIEAYEWHVSAVPVSKWHKYFENWFIQMQKCINAGEEHFEKQWNIYPCWEIISCITF